VCGLLYSKITKLLCSINDEGQQSFNQVALHCYLISLKTNNKLFEQFLESCLYDQMFYSIHLQLQVTWQDTKGSMVICGAYEISVKMMGDSGFLSSLLNFPKEQINDETVELLQPYFAAPDFNFESARKASGNVAGMR
jgi:hypothetical protein